MSLDFLNFIRNRTFPAADGDDEEHTAAESSGTSNSAKDYGPITFDCGCPSRIFNSFFSSDDIECRNLQTVPSMIITYNSPVKDESSIENGQNKKAFKVKTKNEKSIFYWSLRKKRKKERSNEQKQKQTLRNDKEHDRSSRSPPLRPAVIKTIRHGIDLIFNDDSTKSAFWKNSDDFARAAKGEKSHRAGKSAPPPDSAKQTADARKEEDKRQKMSCLMFMSSRNDAKKIQKTHDDKSADDDAADRFQSEFGGVTLGARQAVGLVDQVAVTDDSTDHQNQNKTESKNTGPVSDEVSADQDFQNVFFEELKNGSFDSLGFPVDDQTSTGDADDDVFTGNSWAIPADDQEPVCDRLDFPVNDKEPTEVTHGALDKYGFPLYGQRENPSTLYYANGRLHYSGHLYLGEESITL